MMKTVGLLVLLIFCLCAIGVSTPRARAAGGAAIGLPRPTASQVAWQNAELGIFFHYDLQVAHPGYRAHDPKLLGESPFLSKNAPDTDQWLRVAKAMGARYAVYVCKHNSGYMFFQCRAYHFGLSYSTWLQGKCDMVRRFVASCHRFGIQPGLYCSMATNRYWHVANNGRTSNPARQAAYSAACVAMETSLWHNYGPLFYCWFDGGVLPISKGGPNLTPVLQRLQPNMVCFQGPAAAPGGLTRWIGNEGGQAPNPCWSTVSSVNNAGGGDANGRYWQPAEVDVSVLAPDQWFWKPKGPNHVRTLKQLMQIYYHSVGRGCNLIVNAPIDQFGKVPLPIQKRLAEFGAEVRRRFAHPLAGTSGSGAMLRLQLPAVRTVNTVVLMENITQGQRVRKYKVQGLQAGHWLTLYRGASIGHKWIASFRAVKVTALRLMVSKSVGTPMISRFSAYDTVVTKK